MSDSSLHRQAAARRREIIRASAHQLAYGHALEPADVLDLLAVALASAPQGTYLVKGRARRWPGLCPIDLARRAAEAGLGQRGSDDPEIRRAINEASQGRTIGPEEAGRMLGVDAELRDLLGLRTVEATDEPRSERIARRKEETRLRNRQRMQNWREGKHRPRSESLSVTKPWKALGISRATYFRQQRPETDLCAQIGSGETSLCVRQVCARITEYTGSAHKSVSGSQGAASVPRLQRSGPSTGPSLGAGSGVADGGADGTPQMTGAPGRQIGLGDRSSVPEASAQKNEPARPGRTSPVEDPRERRLQDVFGDRISACYILEELGEGNFDLGRDRADMLGRIRLEQLHQQISHVGILSDSADVAIAEARAAAIEIETTAPTARRAKA
ncbi:hypothetical protein [Bosea sp. LjRoot237]|uniref:hypothetical protein n=1 Tax=Bosea sp. LjRoot237 TaxID=3342292 RepID=UPI003ECF498F